MSSITIVQAYNHCILACDTAVSWYVKDTKQLYREKGRKIDKIKEVGRDAVFLSGTLDAIKKVDETFNSFLDARNRIDIKSFSKYLYENFPRTKKNPISDICVTVISMMGGRTLVTNMSQEDNYTPQEKTVINELYLNCTGFEPTKVYSAANKIINQNNYTLSKTYEKIYNKISEVGIGGSVKVYKYDINGLSLIKERELNEEHIENYCTFDEFGDMVIECNIASPNYVANQKGMLIDLDKGTINSKNLRMNEDGDLYISGDITGSNISGSTLESFGYIDAYTPQKTLIENGFVTSNIIKVRPINSHTEDFSPDSSGYTHIGASQIGITPNGVKFPFLVDRNGAVTLSSINGSTPITEGNRNNYTYNPSSHTQSSYTIYPELTSSGNISLYGNPNAVSTTYADDSFQRKEVSDFRLKKNIRSLEELPIELYMELKPKLFEYKVDNGSNGSVMGLLAQQVESAFDKYGLDPYEYNLIEIVDVKSYTDEGLYISDGKVHRINYNNFIAWNIYVTQDLNRRLEKLEGVN